MTRVRWVEVVRAGWGLALLTAPDRILTGVHHLTVDDRSRVVARVLGVRHLVQAVLSGVSPSPEVLAMGVWVDSVHAASAVGLPVADRSRARAGLTDAAVAASFALVGWRDLGDAHATDPRHDRRRDALARVVLRLAPGGGPLLSRARARRSR